MNRNATAPVWYYAANLIAIGSLALTVAHADAAELNIGPHAYAGVDIGRSSFNTSGLGGPKTDSDESALAAKFYGGYRITEHFGVEGGYARLGGLSETVDLNGTLVHQNARARSFYGAVTGRMPVSDNLALTGKAGLSFGHVSASGSNVPAEADLEGSKRSLMLGLGAEYKVSKDFGVTVGYDHFGKVSNKVSASMLNAGVNYRF